MLIRILVSFFCFFLISCAGEDVAFEACPATITHIGEIKALRVDPCPKLDNGGCILTRGTNVSIEIDFAAGSDSDTLNHRVFGVLFGNAVPYANIGGVEACSRLVGDSTCPIQTGTTYHYKHNFGILASYPAIPLHVRWQLIGPGTTLQVCLQFPVKISS